MLKSLTFADKILIVFTLGTAITSFSLVAALSPEGSTVVVEVEGVPVYKATLWKEAEFTIQGVRGALFLEVKDGGIRVVRAECPNRICVRTGRRSRSGDVIVCVPNKVIVRIGPNQTTNVGGVTG